MGKNARNRKSPNALQKLRADRGPLGASFGVLRSARDSDGLSGQALKVGTHTDFFDFGMPWGKNCVVQMSTFRASEAKSEDTS